MNINIQHKERFSLKEYFLHNFRDRSFVIQQKAYILLWVSIILILLILAATILTVFSPNSNSHLINRMNIAFMFMIVLSLIILRTGRYGCSTYLISITGLAIWTIGLFIKLDGFLATGVNSYLYLMFAIMVFIAMFGSRIHLLAATLYLVAVSVTILAIAKYRADETILSLIISSFINIFIAIFIIFTFSYLISKITSKSLKITETELEKNKELNTTLEKRVETRTEKLQEVMRAITDVNDNLISVNTELEATQFEMQHDMDMAINIQQTFLPKKPPAVNGWDVSFLYKPMAGVSGDFYDFYSVNNNLEGLSLFDVSGHGIASGLITMLAKSIIQRYFLRMDDWTLGKIMTFANRDLIDELDCVGNYLTGVLLRFHKNEVEYVNAGHPDVLIKRGDTQKVKEISSSNCKFRGPLLGVAILKESYPALKFSVKPGDTMLLFSDALVECRNENSEQYGSERLVQSFQSVPKNADAETHIECIMKDLAIYRGNTPIKDDLTVIACKKSA